MTKWTIVLWLLSIGWSVRCQEEVPGPSLERQLQSPGMLPNSGSQLAQMIAKALAAKSQENAKPITSAHVSKLLDDATPEPSSPELMTKTGVTDPDVSGTTPDDIMVEKNEIIYEPVDPGQFGEPGEGSKFLESIQNFDLSKYSLETDGDYSTLAGIGAAALLTIGAIAAVPVAPLILRRTGTSGWGGLPSFSELWGWWSEPDPVAERFANSDYNDNYLNRPHQQQKGRPNKNRGKRPNQQTAQRPYQQMAQRPYQQYAEEEDASEYNYGVNQESQYDNSAWYSDYYDSGSSPSNTNQQYESDSEQSAPSTQPSTGQYNRPSAPNDPTGQYNRPSAEHARLPHHSGNRNPVAHNRRQNKPVKNPEMTDGHEYTTIDKLNKLGEESLKNLYDQFAAHMQGQNIQDFYNPEDNNLRRRHGEYAYMERQGQPKESSYEYEQALMENTQRLSKNYLNNYGTQETEEKVEVERTSYKEFPYDWETVLDK